MSSEVPGKATEWLLMHGDLIKIGADEMTLLQRKCFAFLLLNAQKELLNYEVRAHRMPVDDLVQLLGYNSKNLQYLTDTLEGTQDFKAKFPTGIKRRTGESIYESITILPRVAIVVENGIKFVEYEFFSDEIRQKLYFPDMSAYLFPKAIAEFERTGSLALYMHTALHRVEGVTPVYSDAELRKMLAGNTAYAEFKEFNRSVLQPAIKEVNDKSDIRLESQFTRERRKVVGVSFVVQELLACPQPDVSSTLPDPRLQALKERLTTVWEYSELVADQMIKDHDLDRLEQALTLVEKRYADGLIQPGRAKGYLKKTLENFQVDLSNNTPRGLETLRQQAQQERRRPAPAIPEEPTMRPRETESQQALRDAQAWYKTLAPADQEALNQRFLKEASIPSDCRKQVKGPNQLGPLATGLLINWIVEQQLHQFAPPTPRSFC